MLDRGRMIWTVIILLIFIYNVRCDCRNNGPGNCTFDHSFCNWRENGWRRSNNRAYLCADHVAGSMWSKKLCSTAGTKHCLSFYYYKETDGDQLAVFVRTFDHDSTTHRFSVETNQDWQSIAVSIQTYHNFKLVFTANRSSSGRERSVIGLDNIVYFKQSCHPDVTFSTTTREMTSFSPDLTGKRSTEPTTPRKPKSSTSRVLRTQTSTFSLATAATYTLSSTTSANSLSTPTNVSAAGRETLHTESPNNTATIAGVLFAVIVVFGIGIAVFFLFRQKKLHFWKSLFKGGKPKENLRTRASHNAAYCVDLSDQDNANGVKMNPSDPNYDYCKLDTRTSTQCSEDYYSVIKDTDEFPAQELSVSVLQYSRVNKPRKSENGNTPKGPCSPDDNPYEIKEDTVDCAPKQPPRLDGYKDLKFCTSEQGGPPLASPANGDYNHLRSAAKDTTVTGGIATGVYHYLEDDPEAQQRWDGNGVYHYLQEDPETQQRQDATGLYHCLGDDPETQAIRDGTAQNHYLDDHPETQQRENGAGLYHSLGKDPEAQGPRNETALYILEQDSALTVDRQTVTVYDVPKGERNKSPGKCFVSDAAQNPTPITTDGQDGEYSALHLNGKNSAPERRDVDSGKVYSHLNEGGEDAYSKVDRVKRREIVDNDYYHIK